MKKIFSSKGFYADFGRSIVRIITGILMIYHGWEVWDADKISGYSQWLTDLQFPAPSFMAVLGKSTELVSGILLTLGLFTRLAAVALVFTMLTITFGMGHGKFFTDDQHPFLFILIGMLFFFVGAGKWSLDYLFFDKKPISY